MSMLEDIRRVLEAVAAEPVGTPDFRLCLLRCGRVKYGEPAR